MPVKTKITNPKRTYLDPVHREIVMNRNDDADRLIIDLIDTAEFQRLRRIHQLGVSYFTYQGAEGSRFTHSVGVMFIARQLAEMLTERTPKVADDKALIMACALLHDLGHGPYSHVSEKIIGYNHEDWSCKIIEGDTEVNQVLRSFRKDFPALISGILRKTSKPKYITDIVSSQLDCDRFDYLLRDSYSTGTTYGLFALSRILSALEVDEEQDRIVVTGDKGQTAVEDYLFARYSMYQQVYYHKKNLASRALLSRLIKRARLVGDSICFIDEQTRKWLGGKDLTVKDYLCLDDVQMTYHIKRWANDQDSVLKDLAERFLNRRLFNAIKLPWLTLEEINTVKTKAKSIIETMGFNPDYYTAIETTGLRPYDYYRPEANHPQTNIMVKTENGEIKELSSLSTMAEALIKGSFDTYWLIYPSEAKERIGEMLESQLKQPRK